MTTPDERTRAIVDDGQLLRGLTSAEDMPDVPAYIRKQAQGLLRHCQVNSELHLFHAAAAPVRGDVIAGLRLRARAHS